MQFEVAVCQGLELLEGHIRVALFEGHHGVQFYQAVVQMVRGGGNGLVYGQVGLGVELFVKVRDFEIVARVAQGIRHGEERLPAQVAVYRLLLQPGGLAAGIAETEAGQHLLHVLRIGLLPAVQESFHPHAGRTHAADEVVVATQELFLRVSFLGRYTEGRQGKEYDKNSFHRISILILLALG